MVDKGEPINLKGYELRERIGAGGFGAVYRAYQSTVGREVAVKVILPGLANQPEFIRRFEAEAQIVARLEHPHIVPLHDYWRDPQGAYLVMRWLRGGSLQNVLQKGAYDLPAALLLLDHIAAALSLAHRSQVIHRDIKPSNILLDEDGNAYLTDFGIAKDLNGAGNNTQPDAIVGSLDYISPEQARSEAVTHRTDIYSLGVTFYEVLTGEHPFQNLSSVERLYKHINDPLPDITNLDPALADAVNRVIQKATAKNPEHRYADVLDFAADFRQAIAVQSSPVNLVELLTQREQEILQLIIDGKANKEIAQELTITLSTVKWYINQIFSKLGVRSRVQAMVRARELNLLTKSMTLIPTPPVPTEDFHPENPYKGLHAFQSADNQNFFGREAVTAKLVKRLDEPHEYKRFLAVVGPSGSGKSSIVRAGLIPALWRGDLPGSEKWFIVDMLPGANPLDELEIALTRVAANQSGSLHEQLARDKRGLIRAAQLILPADNSELVLVIDQFEEVFTLVGDEAARVHFLDLLHTAVTEPRSRVRVLITLRADFYDRPLHYPDFGELIHSRMETLLPLSAHELEQAISKPAQGVGVSFEPGLVAQIVAEVNYQAGALPLLQYALTELFEQRRGRLLTREAHSALGSSVGALARRADEIFTDFNPVSQEAARQMFLRLVTLGEGVEDTRRRVKRSELLALISDSDVMDEVIDTYADYRLLSLDNDPATRSPTVELAHEAILRAWERLRDWLNESREDIKSQRQLASMAAEWRASNQDASFLARGARLAQFENWIATTQLALTRKERDYLDASVTQRTVEDKAERERKAREKLLEKRSIRFLRALVVVMFVALIGAIGLIGLAVNQSQIAQRNAAEAQNIALISGSQTALVKGRTDEAIALAFQAVQLDFTSAGAQATLSEAVYTPGTVRRYMAHSAAVDDVAISPDGRTFVSASWDKTLILWDIETGAILHTFEGHTDRVTSVAFSPDGNAILSGSTDKTLILWDVRTGTIIRRFAEDDEVWGLDISPDGRLAVASGKSNIAILWDIQTGQMIQMLGTDGGHTGPVESPTFSPDGRTVLTAGWDETLILWDVQTGDIIRRFGDDGTGHTDPIFTVAFSPDGRTALSGGGDSTIILWDIQTGDIIRRMNGIQHQAATVTFSPDGHQALSADGDNVVIQWNVDTGESIHRFKSSAVSQAATLGVAFTPDGQRAISGAIDGEIRLLDLEDGLFIRRFAGRGGLVNVSERSADGRIALTGYADGTTIIWDVQSGLETGRYTSPYEVQDLEISPDGLSALMGSGRIDGTIGEMVLLDIITARVIQRFEPLPSAPTSVSLSPDGRTALLTGTAGYIILWDVATGTEIRRFTGYESDDFNYSYMGVYEGSFSLDGTQIRTAIPRNTMYVYWDVSTGREVRRAMHLTTIQIDDPNRNTSLLFWDKVVLIDTTSDVVLKRYPELEKVPFMARVRPAIDISSDWRFGVGGGSDGTTRIWDMQSGNITRRISTAGRIITTVSIGPDGRDMLVGFLDGGVELWRIDSTSDELLDWVTTNRYVPELSCDQREVYRVEPLCEDTTTPPA